MKYSEYLADILYEQGYRKCFTLGGGNIMHLVESFSSRFEMIPVVHEVTAGMAAEHFNAVQDHEKAMVLVTTGPGLTNCVTAIASAYVESRELLVIGGQVKTSDLAPQGVRQIGIQEIAGVEIVKPITKVAKRAIEPIVHDELNELISASHTGRKGPVFLEIPLDVQAREVEVPEINDAPRLTKSAAVISVPDKSAIMTMLQNASRPILLLGSGISFEASRRFSVGLEGLGIPVMTTWNAADRFDNTHPLFMGRPNNWGQRYANILIQQADLVIAIGARLGLQQTGFNWQKFAPLAQKVQIDIDPNELNKGRPHLDLAIKADADEFLEFISSIGHVGSLPRWIEWLEFCHFVKSELPVSEAANSKHIGCWNPYDFYLELSRSLSSGDVLLPCSSGSSFTSAYQSIEIRSGNRVFSSKALASMGYGLGAAVGIAAASGWRPVLVEGDGGFAQNLQDLGTLFRLNRHSKIFIWDNDGYASIRKTQQSYFGGNYVGCDRKTGLVLPNLIDVAKGFGISARILEVGESLEEALEEETQLYLVPIHPDQTYFPKLTSRILSDGSMESAPLHHMTPDLPREVAERVFRFGID